MSHDRHFLELKIWRRQCTEILECGLSSPRYGRGTAGGLCHLCSQSDTNSFRSKTAGPVNVKSEETDGVGISFLAEPVSTFHRDLIKIKSLSDFHFHLYL
jgi:hypothetical protein